MPKACKCRPWRLGVRAGNPRTRLSDYGHGWPDRAVASCLLSKAKGNVWIPAASPRVLKAAFDFISSARCVIGAGVGVRERLRSGPCHLPPATNRGGNLFTPSLTQGTHIYILFRVAKHLITGGSKKPQLLFRTEAYRLAPSIFLGFR